MFLINKIKYNNRKSYNNNSIRLISDSFKSLANSLKFKDELMKIDRDYNVIYKEETILFDSIHELHEKRLINKKLEDNPGGVITLSLKGKGSENNVIITMVKRLLSFKCFYPFIIYKEKGSNKIDEGKYKIFINKVEEEKLFCLAKEFKNKFHQQPITLLSLNSGKIYKINKNK